MNQLATTLDTKSHSWAYLPLEEVVDVLDSRRKPITQRDRVAGPYPYYGATGVLDYVDGFLFDEPLVLVGEDGAKWGAGDNSAFQICGKTWVNNHAHVLRPQRCRLLDQWLIYYLNATDLSEFISGMTVPKLNQGRLREIPIPLPPLDEQKRIVAILDQAFAALDRARANVEQNQLAAGDIFQTVLECGDGEKVALGSLVQIRTGKLDANAAVEKGAYPFFTCAREIYAIDTFAFDCEAILLAGNNAVGDFNVKHYRGKFNAYQRTYVITVADTERLLYRHLYFQLLRALKQLKENSVGAGTKFLKLGMINDLKISLPEIARQKEIVMKLDALLEGTKRLESVYAGSLTDLNELKSSLLNKAFAGQLN